MKNNTRYRPRNWSNYNRALKQRGSLTVWISTDAIAKWTSEELTGERGASPKYTDLAIETMAMAQAIYRLPGRQTQGLLESVFELMKLKLPVPDHSTLSRRRQLLTITWPVKDKTKSRHLVVDSTGVKVYGEGEWKVRQHGFSKYRTWRKLHICVDEETREIVSAVASSNDVSDGEVLSDLLNNAPGQIDQVSADGAYDQRKCYDALNRHGTKAAIPPRKSARIWKHANSKSERHVRDENLRRIRKVGRKKWKCESSYHRRSLAETTVFRLKTIFGDRIRTRKLENQFKELLLWTSILNRMTHLGIPDSCKITS